MSTSPTNSSTSSTPEEFLQAQQDLERAPVRGEVKLTAIPAPQRLSPHALAYDAQILTPVTSGSASAADQIELSSGRFVLLYHPDGQPGWDGRFRCVTLIQAQVDMEMANDPLLPEVAWSWLLEALSQHRTEAKNVSGTVTRTASQSFGTLASEERTPAASENAELTSVLEPNPEDLHGDLEIRASWTAPTAALGPHLLAWTSLLAQAGGLPLLPEGVVSLSQHRSPSHFHTF